MSLFGTLLRGGRPALRANYSGAQYNRLTLDWYASLLSADRELRSSLRTLRARSRDLCRNTPHGASLLNLFATNVVGDCGIRLQNRVTLGSGALRKSTNTAVEEGWKRWGEVGVCTVDGRLSIEEAEALYITTLVMDGEVLIRHREGYDNEFGYAIQFLDADLLDENFNRAPAPGQNEIRMGVEINGDGRAVKYHLWPGHPSDLHPNARVRVPVPADQIIHDFMVCRAGQTRGIPLLTPTMFRFKMLDAYIENEIIASRASAAKPVYFETDPEHAAEFWGNLENPTEPLKMEFEPGTATQLPPGVKAVQMDPTHPTTAHEGFVKAGMRDIAVGSMVSYTGLTGDLREVNYSSLRDGTIRERDVWRTFQRRTTRHFLTPVSRRWLKWSATTGAVRLPTLDVNRWFAPAWQPRGWQWVDPKNDLESAQMEIDMKLTSRTILAAERGRDFEEILAQQAEEEQLAKTYGVSLLLPGRPNSSRHDALPPDNNTGTDAEEPSPEKKNGKSNGTNGNGHNRLSTLDLTGLLP